MFILKESHFSPQTIINPFQSDKIQTKYATHLQVYTSALLK